MCRPITVLAIGISLISIAGCSKNDLGVEPAPEPLKIISGTVILPDTLKSKPVLISFARTMMYGTSSERLDRVEQMWADMIRIDTLKEGTTERQFSLEFPEDRNSFNQIFAWVDLDGNGYPADEPIRLPFKFSATTKSVLGVWEYIASEDDFSITVNTTNSESLRGIGTDHLLLSFN